MYTVVDGLTGLVMCVYTREEDAPVTLAQFKEGADTPKPKEVNS